ncbi:MAG TPA: VCBS domain-containing protein [Ktedonobacteraceae bacterium]|nr:VCBS domain-containing protein [Ktedonobacteraceae bacterium]
MSLVNQQVGSYRLVRKLRANQNYKIYQEIQIRSSEERIIQLVKLVGKLNKKESRIRLRKKVESLRAINSPHVIPILKYDFATIKGNNYFYTRIPCFFCVSLKEWLQLRAKTKSLPQQDADNIMRQAYEAVEVFHKSGIAHLNLELSSFMIEMTEVSNCPRVFLNDFLLAVLSTERIREDEVRRKQAITEDQNALKEIEKLLNQNVEETVIEPAESLESPIQILERRLVIAEEEKGQLQCKLRELEEEKERIIQELQEQREEERRRLILAEEEKERIIRDLRELKESDTKLLDEAILASTGISGADATPIVPSSGGTSPRSGRWFWGPGALLLLMLLFAGTTCLLAGLFFFAEPVRAFFDSSSAKVTIRQAAYELPDSYIFTGVTHSISKEKSRSVTVPATNLVLIPGRKATGILTFRNTQNLCNVATAIPAGTVFTGSQGISVVTDHVVFLGASCTATARAHAVKIGSIGDIGAHNMKQTYHSTIIVDNPEAFIGGHFDQSYTTVQQSDIDQAASSLAPRLKKETQNVLRMQLQTNEQFVTSPICKSKVTSDHLVNDATTNLIVTVTVNCTAEFYDSQEVISRSEQMLNERAQALFGPNYRLTGEIKAEITHVATDVRHGTLITVVASGLWTYQFSRARTEQIAQLIAAKNKRDAKTILSDQKGVQSVSINISNNDNTIPAKANSINIAYVTTLVPIEEGTASSFIY